ncbi:MAG: hypothetical protein RIR00_2258 [Pseudomonadota bacterium]|jgi:antibiotic biosynthesis monooxygenase (ABM) superfamily enzyme
MTTPETPVGVTRIARRQARPACGAAYEALLRGMIAEMSRFPGFIAAQVLPPDNPDGEYQTSIHFRSEAELAAWDRSRCHRLWLERLRPVAEGEPDYRLLSGLEAWFALPLLPAHRPPPRGKMSLLTWLGIFPTVSLCLHYVAPLLADLPFLLRTALLTGLVVPIMTYLVMPRLTRWARGWLQG